MVLLNHSKPFLDFLNVSFEGGGGKYYSPTFSMDVYFSTGFSNVSVQFLMGFPNLHLKIFSEISWL